MGSLGWKHHQNLKVHLISWKHHVDHYTLSPGETLTCFLNIFRDDDSSTSLGNSFQSLLQWSSC